MPNREEGVSSLVDPEKWAHVLYREEMDKNVVLVAVNDAKAHIVTIIIVNNEYSTNSDLLYVREVDF